MLRKSVLPIGLFVLGFLICGSLAAQDLSGLRIAIDPGHGTNTPNQGPTGLKEYDVNMRVARFLETLLYSANVDTVILTQIEDRPEPGLSAREDIANSAGVDWFHSIHHNAFDGNIRYTVVIYQEIIGQDRPKWPEAVDMSTMMSLNIYDALRTSAWYVRSDYDIRGFNFGVLNELLMPGELSEATFHDNAVEERKLRNPEFLMLEALAIYKSILNYFEADSMELAPFSGIIKDLETSQPINGAQVVIGPTSQEYNTDGFDNGLFIFPELTEGTYSLEVSAPGYETANDTVEVVRNRFTSLDINLVSHELPSIKASNPVPGDSLVSPYNWFEIEFTRQMNPEAMESALVIEPDISYSLRWLDDGYRLLIDPHEVLHFNTEYMVMIDSTASDIYGNHLNGDDIGETASSYSLHFRTEPVDLSKPQILETYPLDTQNDIRIGDVVRIMINKPLDEGALNNANIIFYGHPSQEHVNVAYRQTVTKNGTAILTLIPLEPLKSEQRYAITLLRSLVDSNAVGLDANFQFVFFTEQNDLEFWQLDGFDNGIGNWGDPIQSQRTVSIDVDETGYSQVNRPALRDTLGALRLDFQFSNMGLLDVPYQGQLATLEYGDIVGTYVYGDSSLSFFRFYFLDPVDGLESGPWHEINWKGWRMISYEHGVDPLTAYEEGNGYADDSVQLEGIQVKGNSENSGSIVIDDIYLLSSQTTPVAEEDPIIPREQLLMQGYPNPFSRNANHSNMVITYEIPPIFGEAKVILSVFNLLGQRVRQLVNQIRPPGTYHVTWNVLDETQQTMPAGVYFLRLQVGDTSKTLRFVILN